MTLLRGGLIHGARIVSGYRRSLLSQLFYYQTDNMQNNTRILLMCNYE